MTSFSEYQARLNAGEPIAREVAVPREARPYQGHRAGFFTRIIAAIIDVLAVAAVVVLLNLSIAFVRMLVSAASNIEIPKFGFSVSLGTFLLWLGWTAGWATTGRSLGMHIMGIRVVNHVGVRLGWGLSALRSIFCVAFPIGLIWVIVSPANRSVQDLVLRSSVVYDWVVTLADEDRPSDSQGVSPVS